MSSLARNLLRGEQPPGTPEAGRAAGEAQPEPAEPAARRPAIPLGYRLAHLASLAAGGAFLLKLDHWTWFWFDDWDFIGDRGLVHSRLGLWAPHNDHWSTLPILAYRALLTLFGMGSYLPFLILLTVLHLALAHVLWRMSLRVGASPLVATALITVFAFFGAGAQNVVWAFQIGFVGSVLFGWLWLWVTDHDGGFGRRDVAGWGLGLASLMCSGIGVPMLMTVAVAVGLRRGVRAAALAVSAPVAAFAVWYVLYGRLAERSAPIDKSTVLAIGSYTFAGIENAFSTTVGFAGAGAVLAVGLVYGLLRRDRSAGPSDAIARAGAAGVVLTYAFIGIGRSGLGALQVDRTRYVYIAIALVLPAAALLLTACFRPGRGPLAVFGLIIAVVFAVNVNDLVMAAHTLQARALPAKQQILAGYDLANDGSFVFPAAPTVTYFGPAPTVGDLRQIHRNGWLGPPAYRVLPQSLLGAKARLQVGVLPAGTAAPATVPAVITRTAELSVVPAAGGCLTVTTTGRNGVLVLAPAASPVLLTMTRQVPGELYSHLSDARSPAPAIPRAVRLAGRTRFLVGATGVRTTLALPTGRTRICGVAATR
ncbi:MAG TPA: hypothetical protein VK599_08615 [Streptosporangiaceae bacterium]|nr:hypothetical protein [Streptosporangiaceae bacterium]